MSTHTPGPWRVVHTADDRTFIDTEESNDNFIAQIDRNIPEYESNAAFIVRACNSHAAMLEALAQAQSVLGDLVRAGGAAIDEIEAHSAVKEAIRLAEGMG